MTTETSDLPEKTVEIILPNVDDDDEEDDSSFKTSRDSTSTNNLIVSDDNSAPHPPPTISTNHTGSSIHSANPEGPSQRSNVSNSRRVSNVIKNVTHVSHNVTHTLTNTVERSSKFTFSFFRRGILNIPHKWPRVYSILIGVIMPLWLLIAVSVVLGLYLSKAEMPGEIASNDSILEQRANDLLAQAIEDGTVDWGTNTTNSTRLLEVTADGRVLQDSPQSFEVYFEGASISAFDGVSNAYSSLSFNWIRCWDDQQVDLHRVFRPTKEHITHARYDSQLEYYTQSWTTDHHALYNEFLSGFDQPDANLHQLAFERAAADATGSEGCQENFAGTAWFWFTIMTTVGYGNQAPSSQGGRAMIWTAGFFSILLFAGVLGFSGYIFSSIFEDTMSRIKWHYMKVPAVGCLLWGTLWFLWMLVISSSVDKFWTNRLGDSNFASNGEQLWFAYISTTTVGLGDFYLQPEVTFLVDVLNFSLQFLVGFVFLSSFLAKFGDFLSKLAPNIGARLQDRLKDTHLFMCEPTDFGFPTNFRKGDATKERRERRYGHLIKLLHDHEREDENGQRLGRSGTGDSNDTLQDESLLHELMIADHDEDNEDEYDKILKREAAVLRKLLEKVELKRETREKQRQMKLNLETQNSKLDAIDEKTGYVNSSEEELQLSATDNL